MIAIVPARGGSKRLPRKNLRQIEGKPMIQWTIEAALCATCVRRVIVSTDDEEIGRLAASLGAEVPFMRPAELAEDHVGNIEVLLHCIDYLQKQESRVLSTVVLLQPTSPLRSATDIENAWALKRSTHAISVASVTEAPFKPSWIKTVSRASELHPVQIESQGRKLTSEDRLFVLNGAIYMIDAGLAVSEHSLVPSCTRPYLMPRSRSIDVDTEHDFLIAQQFLSVASATAV